VNFANALISLKADSPPLTPIGWAKELETTLDPRRVFLQFQVRADWTVPPRGISPDKPAPPSG